MKARRYYLLFLGVFIFGLIQVPMNTNALNLKSNVIVLMDFSNSYFTPDRIKLAIPDNFRKLAEAIGSKNDGPDKPSLIQLLPITGVSQSGRAVCEYVLLRKKLFGDKKKSCGSFDETMCSAKVSYFKDFMRGQCSKKVLMTREAKATDISGALSLASQIGQSQGDGDKFLVIFSDMFEYRNPKLPVGKIRLDGFHVLVVCGAEYNSEADTLKLCQGTEGIWADKFKSLGAASVTYTIETGNWHLGSAKEFFDRG